MRRLVGCLGSLAAVTVSGMACASAQAALVQVGTLSVSGNPAALFPLAVSDQTVVAGGSNGIAYVFSEPASGWSSESQSAELVDSGGAVPQPTAIAISGQTVVVNEHELTGPSFEDVFVEPSGGWSGTVPQSARLVGCDGAVLDAPSISAETVVANRGDFKTAASAAYVFTEPTGGWSGTVYEVAKLAEPSASLGYAAVSGDTIVGVGGSRGDVYTEPAGGWGTSASPIARLRDPAGLPLGPVAMAGQTILADNDVFTEPREGWSGTQTPNAEISPVSQTPFGFGCCEAFSGTTAVESAYNLGSEHQCPCDAVAWLLSEPADGWRGTTVATPALGAVIDPGPLAVGVADPYLFTAAEDTVNVYRATGRFGQLVGPPSVLQKALSGLPQGKPRLHFKLKVRAPDPLILALGIALPRGLSFSKSLKRLAAGTSFPGERNSTLALLHHQLLVVFSKPLRLLTVTLHGPALVESRSLTRHTRQLIAINRNRKRSARSKQALPVRLHVTDTASNVSAVTLKLGAE